MAPLNSVDEDKKQCTVGYNDRFTYLFLQLVNLRDLFGVGTQLKKVYSTTTIKSISPLIPKRGFWEQKGPEPDQVQD